ncbi:MAG TPA: hypothetical protein VFS21_02810 [Roseiflexaceae bacterium]|nr:hypothetical protein [Roseiflexaceae bacterium]
MSDQHDSDLRFAGQWVGETQGCEMPAHLWSIRQQGRRLSIQTRWEGELLSTEFFGFVDAGGQGFWIGGSQAILLDPMHFIIPDWCTNDRRGGVGPSYDVVFSRPGLAELSATAVWQRYRENDRRDGENAESGKTIHEGHEEHE